MCPQKTPIYPHLQNLQYPFNPLSIYYSILLYFLSKLLLCCISGYIFLVGGSHNSHEVWSKTELPTPVQYPALPRNDFYGSRAALFDNTIYTCGGVYTMRECYSIPVGGGAWSRIADMQVIYYTFLCQGRIRELHSYIILFC